MFFSPHSSFDHSFLRIRGNWLGLGGPDLRALHLDVPPQSRLCHDHPPPCTEIPYVVTQATRLQPQQQLRPPQQQQFGQRSLQRPQTGFLPRSFRPGRAETQLQGVHLPPSPQVQSNRTGGRGRKPSHCAHCDLVDGISSKGDRLSCHSTQAWLSLGVQQLERN